MMRDNLIEKLEGPSSLLKSYVIERKHSGKPRICSDSKPLNKALINNYHCQVPSLESIIHRFANKKAIKFSKLDVSRFWHCKLNDKVRELTAFGTFRAIINTKDCPWILHQPTRLSKQKVSNNSKG